MTSSLPETILQFGTGKFLRCFVDLFVDQCNRADRPVGRIVVVQSTGSDRAAWFSAQQGRFHVAVRGLRGGRRVDEQHEVSSVSESLAASSQWTSVLQFARTPSLRAVVSNTTEAGFVLEDNDRPTDSPPRSFPAKLLQVLMARYEAGLGGLAILPCELLDNNATRLRELVVEQARRWELDDDRRQWFQAECRWHNTLVDRIVAAAPIDDPMAARDPLYAVAEPYAFWAIEAAPDLPGLAEHPAVQLVDDVAAYSLRKVRILNGAHTALVAKAMPRGLALVRDAVLDSVVGPWLERLLFDEIAPTLEGRVDRPEAFARDVLERFRNPFLDHRLADIALHHATKLQTRLAPTRDEFRQRFGRDPELLDGILLP